MLSKYGVARHVYIPIVKRGVVDFAVGADWTPAAGDVKISKDGGAAANVTNLPAAIVMGNTAMWDFSLTAAEMQAAQVAVTIADAATKAVEDDGFLIETYGNASGQHAFDLGTASVTVGTNGDKTGYALTAAEETAIADALLKRDMSAVAGEAARSPLNALRFLRNLWSIAGGTLTVKKEDDATTAWTGAVTTTAGNPVSQIDPT